MEEGLTQNYANHSNTRMDRTFSVISLRGNVELYNGLCQVTLEKQAKY
jgi:hypothetical protein